MDQDEIKINLRVLGVNSIEQINLNSLNYWWKRKKIEIKSSNLPKEEIKEKLIKLNESKEFLDKVNEVDIKESLSEITILNSSHSNNEINENQIAINHNFNESQLKKIYLKRPDLKPKKIPSYKNVKLVNPPTLDQIIVGFLSKYDIFIEPRNMGEWNGWDTFGTIFSLFSYQNSTRDLASSLFYMNRSH